LARTNPKSSIALPVYPREGQRRGHGKESTI
jgi:hypothetical protein